MTDLVRTARLLLPPSRGVALYSAGSFLFLVFIAAGLRIEGERATLWGLTLTRAFGVSVEERCDGGFVEMLQHAWSFGTLPWICFSGMRPLLRTFEPQFRQFLRFSRRSRLFVETGRFAAAAAVLGIGLMPLAAGAAAGGIAGVGTASLGHALATCAVASAVVIVVLYGLAALLVPSGTTMSLGLAVPWFLTATGEFLRRNSLSAANRLPVGLPYTIESWSAPEVSSSMHLVALVVAVRFAFCIRTRHTPADE